MVRSVDDDGCYRKHVTGGIHDVDCCRWAWGSGDCCGALTEADVNHLPVASGPSPHGQLRPKGRHGTTLKLTLDCQQVPGYHSGRVIGRTYLPFVSGPGAFPTKKVKTFLRNDYMHVHFDTVADGIIDFLHQASSLPQLAGSAAIQVGKKVESWGVHARTIPHRNG